MQKYGKLMFAIIGCELVGFLATPFTIAAIPTWYAHLSKPPFSPPNWVFGPVWTLLYLLMGIAIWLVWMNKKSATRQNAITAFLIQLVLNFFWSVIFFGAQQPLLALIEIAALWIAIFITILKFHKVSPIASYLLVPYLLWVSFATVLNVSIVVLN